MWGLLEETLKSKLTRLATINIHRPNNVSLAAHARVCLTPFLSLCFCFSVFLPVLLCFFLFAFLSLSLFLCLCMTSYLTCWFSLSFSVFLSFLLCLFQSLSTSVCLFVSVCVSKLFYPSLSSRWGLSRATQPLLYIIARFARHISLLELISDEFWCRTLE